MSLTRIAPAERNPPVGLGQVVRGGDVGVEGGEVGQGLTRGQEFQRGDAAVPVGNGAGRHVVAAVVAVLQRHHQAARLRQQLDGVVAVHRGYNNAAVQRRTLAPNADEDGLGRAGRPVRVVDIVGLSRGGCAEK